MNLLLKICKCSYLFELLSLRFEHLKTNGYRRTIPNIIFDVILGSCFSVTFNYIWNDSTIIVTDYIINGRDETRIYLEDLIQWLMAVPAGLKLNHELSHFLGNFFLSHIYIWIGYLHILEPYLAMIVSLVIYSGYLGLSVVFALVNDFVGMLTCHIYCFYVYAAKLYGIQLQALISLARLFIGKKWNVLRLRVDSVTYEADQLIVGTILFTILLFLLPTTLVFYVVFATLRISVFILQASLSTAVYVITRFSVVEILLKMKRDVFGVNNISALDDQDEKVSRDYGAYHLTYYQLIESCFNGIELNILDNIKKLCTGTLVSPWSSLRE